MKDWWYRLESVDWSRYIDRELLVALMAIMGLGIVMLASASLWVAEKQFQDAYHFFNRQLIFIVLGVMFAVGFYQVPINFWQRLGVWLLPISLFLLVIVLIPQIGKEVNGSRRWLSFGMFSLQVSELVKLVMLLYLAGYMVRHGNNLAHSPSYKPLFIPVLVLGVTGGLLMLEPDFGAALTITMIGGALLVLGGVPWLRISILGIGALVLAIPLVLMGYRGARINAFWDPWQYETGTGYQTVHALMAIGDGGWLGNGLGGGVQKLFYLPEAHNDFIFSVLAEEFGFIGIIVVLALYAWLVFRAFNIGFQADKNGLHFGGYVAYGIGFWMGFQVIFHVGVNLAVLPSKGLTLPLMSYGGSSMLITCMAMGLLMRVHRDTQAVLWGSTGYRRTPAKRKKATPTTTKKATPKKSVKLPTGKTTHG